MTSKERQKFSKAIKATNKMLKESKPEAQAFLTKAGIITKSGNIAKHYKHLCINLAKA